MRCLPLYSRTKSRGVEKGKRVATLEEEKIIRWAVNDKEDWGREEKIKEDHRKIEELVPGKFLKWRKVFGKIESERMLIEKFGIMLLISRRRSNHKREESTLYLKTREKKFRTLWKIN